MVSLGNYHKLSINLGQPTGWVVATAVDWGLCVGVGWGGNNVLASTLLMLHLTCSSNLKQNTLVMLCI